MRKCIYSEFIYLDTLVKRFMFCFCLTYYIH